MTHVAMEHVRTCVHQKHYSTWSHLPAFGSQQHNTQPLTRRRDASRQSPPFFNIRSEQDQRARNTSTSAVMISVATVHTPAYDSRTPAFVCLARSHADLNKKHSFLHKHIYPSRRALKNETRCHESQSCTLRALKSRATLTKKTSQFFL